MTYGTYGLVSVSKQKPRWLIKTLAAIIAAAVFIFFLVNKYL